MDDKRSGTALVQPAAQRSIFREDVVKGLSSSPKRIAAKYFYDARGSELFDGITRQSEYYVTRCELAILDTFAERIAGYLPEQCVIIEFGSGSSIKIDRVLRSSSRVAGYVPVDISPEMLQVEAQKIAADFSGVRVEGVAADFTRRFSLPAWAATHPRVGFFPGSTIGNFDPIDAHRLLSDAARTLGNGGLFIVGVDLVKDAGVLHAAYNDAAGVTAQFNLNLLERCNRELGSNFDTAKFSHSAIFRRDMNRVEMHLIAQDAQTVQLGERVFSFEPNESIHTENSYKYTVHGFRDLAQAAGWQSLDVLLDQKSYFSVHILRQV